MIKQHNIFTGKIDLITDPADSRAKIALAMYELDRQAGRIYGAQAPKPKTQKNRNENQTTLF